jgi:putative nucleotidyltransferase with HDIG domain
MEPPASAASDPRPWATTRLPPFPAVAVRLLAILDKEDASHRDVAALLRTDPAFGSEVLRMANSAAFIGHGGVSGLSEAVLRLGTRTLSAVAMTVGLRAYTRNSAKAPAHRAAWQHSLATAFVGEALARAAQLPAERVYTAGLLHDVGRLALLAAYPREYSRLLTGARDPQDSLVEVERAMFDLDHTEAGAHVARAAGFPDPLPETIAGHHAAQPPRAPPSRPPSTWPAAWPGPWASGWATRTASGRSRISAPSSRSGSARSSARTPRRPCGRRPAVARACPSSPGP